MRGLSLFRLRLFVTGMLAFNWPAAVSSFAAQEFSSSSGTGGLPNHIKSKKRHSPSRFRQHRSPISRINSRRTEFYYSDDLFGLIFISSAFLRDRSFATVFFVCSVMASIYANVNKVKAGSIFPGIVALAALALVVLLRSFRCPAFQLETPSTLMGYEEIVVCFSSFVYGFVVDLNRNRDDSSD